jgi:hypothetical protein
MFDTLFHIFCAFSIWWTIAYFGSAIFRENAHPVFKTVCTWLLVITGIVFMFYAAEQRKLHPDDPAFNDPEPMSDESDRP